MVVSAAAVAGIGAAGGIVGGLLNTGVSAGINAAAASKAHDRQKNMMTRGPTYIMQGLRDAGINPILAAGSGGLGGSAAKISQAHAARGADTATQGALVGSQIRLQDAATAKAVAEKDIIVAGQPAANWNAKFNSTPEGERLLEMDRVNRALPQTIGAGAARGVYQLWGKSQRDFAPNSGRWPSRITPPRNYQQEDNRR